MLAQNWGLATAGLALFVLANVSPVVAMQFDLGEETSLDVDVSLAYAAGWRLGDQDSYLMNPPQVPPNVDTDALFLPNGDDGNRNFDKGDMMNNRFSTNVDVDLKHKNVGVFVRARAYYDYAYDGSNANHSGTFNNNLSGNSFVQDTQDQHRDKTEILDAFVYSNFDLGGHNLMLRVGQQVVSWGESLFVPGGISSAQSPVDATSTVLPGVELRDIFLPVQQVVAQVDLIDNLTLGLFYQWDWEKTRLPGVGSYFSGADFLDEGGNYIIAPTGNPAMPYVQAFPRSGDIKPSDSGQWGAALRYLAEGLNDTEFGLYYINYHEKAPNMFMEFDVIPDFVPGVGGMFSPTGYHLGYAEDVQLYGASFGTVFGDTNVSGEVTYRQDFPIQVKDALSLVDAAFFVKEVDLIQAQVSAIHLIAGTPVWSSCTLMGEIGYNEISNYGDAILSADDSAWGGTIKVIPSYLQIMPGLDLNVPITYKFNGDSTASFQGSFDEKNDSVSIGFDFTYLQVYQAGVAYTNFLNDAEDNPLADRDFVSVNLKYTF
jgi:hypothetical protein